MSRFRLRYGTTNLELFPGEFTIGRSSGCNLALADNLVSRRHAVIRVDETDVVTVEDLGSRNGIAVNGTRTRGASRLSHMDRIYVGAQELILIDGGRMSSAPMGTSVICGECGAVNGKARRRCAECGALLSPEAAATLEQHSRPSLVPHTWGGPDSTRTETTRDVIDGIAAKAVELGRFEEAERILRPHLDRLMQRALSGEPLSRSGSQDADLLLARATKNALELAFGLRNCAWIDWVFEIHIATGRLMQMETIETLSAVARGQRCARRAYVQAYVKSLRERASEWDESEQLCVRRLEELVDEIAAH